MAVARLVGFVGDGAANPEAAQVGAVLAGGVRLASPHPIGADAWSARPDAGHADRPWSRRSVAEPGADLVMGDSGGGLSGRLALAVQGQGEGVFQVGELLGVDEHDSPAGRGR